MNDAPAPDAGSRKGQISKQALRALGERIADIARALLGPENPHHSTPTELRWGTNGSISVEIAGPEAGAYYNHERKIGGGPLQLLAIEGGMATAAAVDWLRDTLGIEMEREAVPAPQYVVATYDYQDERGEPVYRVTKWGPRKTFTQSKADGAGGWLSGKGVMEGVRLVPYRLPELLASGAAVVYVVEGEKDADRLWSIGLPATCNPGGAGKWLPEFAPFFAGRSVVILPDNDKAGSDHASLVARSLPTAARVQVVRLPGLPAKGDVSDWLDAGGTAQALAELVSAADAPTESAGDLIDPDAPYTVAGQFLARNYTSSGMLTLHHHRETLYAWNGSAYHETSEDTLRAQLYAYLNRCSELDPKGKRHPVKPNTTLVNHVLDALRAATQLADVIAAPCWLGSAAAPADELISCANGLLHLPSLHVLPHSPAFFCLNALEFAYDPDTPEPTEWLRFMADLWGSDPAAIETLQEMFGLALTSETKFQKAFLLIGPPRCGKGTIARVLARLIGTRNVVAPVLSSLGTDFGLAPLLGKLLAIISDARLSARADQAAISERILSITGEDALTVSRKYKDAWTGSLPVRFLILSNELPGITDASGALASRFIILTLSQSFLGREDHGLTNRLLKELTSILNWSIVGWHRLCQRGYFVQPKSADDLSQDFADLGSPIGTFIREACETKSGYTASIDDLYKVWCWWCQEQGRDKPGTKQVFGRNLRAALPELRMVRPRDDAGSRSRFYEGIRIKPIRQLELSGVDLNDAPLQRDEMPKVPWWIN